MTALSEPFRTSTNVSSFLLGMAPLLLVAAGQAVVILTAGIDLSVGAVVSLATVLVVVTSDTDGTGLVAVALVIGAGALIGLLNGAGVVAGVNPLVMTLGSMGVVKGVALLLLPSPGGTVANPLLQAVTWSFGPVPASVLVAGGIVLVVWLLTAETRFGLALYALGESAAGARRAGLPRARVLLTAYAISGVCAALAGLALVGRIFSGDALVGDPLALDSITAVLLAGVTITGGRGAVVGVVPGVALLALIDTVLNLTGVVSYYQYIAKGLILIVALALYEARGGALPGGLRVWRPAAARSAAS